VSRAINLDCQSPLVIVEGEDEERDEGAAFDTLAAPAVELFRLASSTAAAEATRETFPALVDFPGTALARKVQSGLRASRTSLAAKEDEGELDEEEGLDEEGGLGLGPAAASSPRATSDAAPRSSWISSSVTEPREARAEAHSATTEDAAMEDRGGGGLLREKVEIRSRLRGREKSEKERKKEKQKKSIVDWQNMHSECTGDALLSFNSDAAATQDIAVDAVALQGDGNMGAKCPERGSTKERKKKPKTIGIETFFPFFLSAPPRLRFSSLSIGTVPGD